MLLLDSYGGHTNSQFSAKADELDIDIRIIPKSTTRFCQPLDVYFFRQYKVLTFKIVQCQRNRFFDKIDSIKPKDRLFLIKMHSIVYNQLQSILYRPMLVYAWRKPGYDTPEEVPAEFKSVLEINFDIRNQTCCECDSYAFIHCSHCRKYFCYAHFMGPSAYHMHPIQHSF